MHFGEALEEGTPAGPRQITSFPAESKLRSFAGAEMDAASAGRTA
jgi:hypothetical protein